MAYRGRAGCERVSTLALCQYRKHRDPYLAFSAGRGRRTATVRVNRLDFMPQSGAIPGLSDL
jgi:hypothetical protein